ncbi:hypothetical protein NEMIN01_1952 [Nematocida minor]|uniref:uncharacterized protein n=1 Tax=Nematocida minor TaxID=1912983 RepID=UPI0022209D1D|nr:uncharacterized protein NEMIN01_1952 [Nematocida minor]KAI5192338.1 hypothetical protein NEMIN01_1952 [Nematocida minor]
MDKLQTRKRKIETDENIKKQDVSKGGARPSECSYCRAKLRITNTFGCKCRRVFCAKHRYSDEHRCSYDYRTENMLRLEKENPRIIPSRISNA